MRNLFVLTAAAAVLFGAALAGRLNESPLQTAALDWERGDYISALDTYLRVLDSSTSPADLDAIALQTGELYRTTELTTDGALPRFSPDGRTLLYQSGLGLGRLTRLLPANGLTVGLRSFTGSGAVYSPDGTRLSVPRGARDTGAHERGGGNRAGTVSGSRPASGRVQRLVAAAARIVVRNLDTGRESEVPLPGFSKAQLAYGAGGVWFSGKGPGDEAVQIYEVKDDGRAAQRTSGPQDQLIVRMNATGTALLCAPRTGAGNAALQRAAPRTFTIIATASGHRTTMSGFAPAFSGDGGALTFVSRNEDGYRLMVAPISEPVTASVVHTGTEPIDAPALTRDGSRVAFQMMTQGRLGDLHVRPRRHGERRLTREIQHDVLPQFLGTRSAARGHRRATAPPLLDLYDLPTDEPHAPLPQQHACARSRRSTRGGRAPDGTKLLIYRRTRRRYGVARARRLPGRPHPEGDARRAACAVRR